MEGTIKIGGREILVKASAYTPFEFKANFGEDVVRGISNCATDDGNVDVMFISKLAWEMAHEADPEIPDLKTWLEGFAMLDILNAAPEIFNFWEQNEKTHSNPVKK